MPESVHGRPFSLALTLPPLAAVFWKPDPEPPAAEPEEAEAEAPPAEAEAEPAAEDAPE